MAVQMNVSMAGPWIDSIEDLNKQLENEVGGVNENVQTIAEDSRGSCVDGLIKNVSDMIQAGTNLINAFTGLVNSVRDAVSVATKTVSTIEGIISGAAAIMGL